MPIFELGEDYRFPSGELAESDPDGLLAVGGDLSIQRLLNAYSQGIFPWFNDDQPILWWSPSERATLVPSAVRLSKSARKTARRSGYYTTINRDFKGVINACATLHGESWITEDMIEAYTALHLSGWVHSVEVWLEDQLVGGLYGVCIFPFFFGESMFSRADSASKFAFYQLCKNLESHDFKRLDCQLVTSHLTSLGASTLDRSCFLRELSTTSMSRSPFSQLEQQWINHGL